MPTLEITTMVGCPLRCLYCPQDALQSAYGKGGAKYLTLEDFRTILAKVPGDVRIDFSGMSEPWANPQATEMLEHALANGFRVAVYTTLYGMKDPEHVADLLRSHARQVEVVALHLPDRNGVMRGYRPSETYAATLDVFLRLRAEEVLGVFRVLTMDRGGVVHPSIRDQVGRLNEWRGLTRAGALKIEGDHPLEATPRHETAVGCSFAPSYDQNVLLPNGDVVLCCMDYSLKHKIGNLLTDDYTALFGPDRMGAMLAENARPGFSERSICKSCVRAQQVAIA